MSAGWTRQLCAGRLKEVLLKVTTGEPVLCLLTSSVFYSVVQIEISIDNSFSGVLFGRASSGFLVPF